jgi:CheY-like chemotaxis protein
MEDRRKKKVLVVDDSPMILSSVSKMLGQKYKVFCASSGMVAIDIIKVQTPDLIFLDYAMPEFNGKDVYEILKVYPGMEDVPIVFLTGMSDREHVKELLELRPAGYLLKPPSPFKIVKMAEKYLG